jgi:hypothetical protein
VLLLIAKRGPETGSSATTVRDWRRARRGDAVRDQRALQPDDLSPALDGARARGRPTYLVKDGKVDRKQMFRASISLPELRAIAGGRASTTSRT